MPREALVFRLIELIYDAALEPTLWPAFLEALSDALDGTAANLIYTGTAGGNVFATVRSHPDAGREYGEHFGRLDPWARAARAHGVMSPGEVIIGDELVSHGQIRKTEYYADFAMRNEAVRILAAAISLEGPVASALSVNRAEQASPFDERDRTLLRVLVPHVRRALQVDSKLAGLALAQRGAEESLDRLPFAAIVLAPDGQVVFANAAAAAILGRNDGLTLTARGLTAAVAHETRSIANMVRDAAQPDDGTIRAVVGVLKISRPSGRAPFALSVMRLRGHELVRSNRSGCAVSVFIDDPDKPFVVNDQMLRAFYDLTAAEAAVASDIAAGLTLCECARQRGVQPSTIRWHLKHVLAKTSTNSQSGLVRLLVRGPAALVLPQH